MIRNSSIAVLLLTLCQVYANQGCIDVVVGWSPHASKTVNVDPMYTCPSNVDKTNWYLGANGENANHGDTFSISQSGSQITVTRTDVNAGWGMTLQFECCVPSDCIDVTVGWSPHASKTVNVDSTYSCPSNVDKTNWYIGPNGENSDFGDTFSTSQTGSLLTVTRTDHYGGWGMPLQFQCCAPESSDLGCGPGNPGPSGCDNQCGSTAEDLGCGCGEPGPSGCDNQCGSTAQDLGCGCGEPGPSGCDNQCGSTAEDVGCGCGLSCNWVELNDGSCRDANGQGYTYCSKDMRATGETLEGGCQAAANQIDHAKVAGLSWQVYDTSGFGICLVSFKSQEFCLSSDLDSNGWYCNCGLPGNGLPQAYTGGWAQEKCMIKDDANNWVLLNTGSCKDGDSQGYAYCVKDMRYTAETLAGCQALVDTVDPENVVGLGWQTYDSSGFGICFAWLKSQDVCASSDLESNGFTSCNCGLPGSGLPKAYYGGWDGETCMTREGQFTAPASSDWMVLNDGSCKDKDGLGYTYCSKDMRTTQETLEGGCQVAINDIDPTKVVGLSWQFYDSSGYGICFVLYQSQDDCTSSDLDSSGWYCNCGLPGNGLPEPYTGGWDQEKCMVKDGANNWVQSNTGSCKDSDGQGYTYCTKDMRPTGETLAGCQALVNTIDPANVVGLGWQTYDSTGSGICFAWLKSQDVCASSDLDSNGFTYCNCGLPGSGLPEAYTGGWNGEKCMVRKNYCATTVTSLIKTILCRVPEASDLYSWVNECQNGVSLATIEQQLRQSQEFQNCAECQQGCPTDKWSTYGEGRCETNQIPIAAPNGFQFDGTFAPPGTMYYTQSVTLEQCGDLCLAQEWCGFFSWKTDGMLSDGTSKCYISAHCNLVNSNNNGFDNESYKYDSYKTPDKYCSRFPDLAELSNCQNCQIRNCILECDCGHGRTYINIKDKCTDTTITVRGGALVCKEPEGMGYYKEHGDVNEAFSIQNPCSEPSKVMRHAECRKKSTSVFQSADASALSDFNGLLWSFGQFVDHDLDLVKENKADIVHIPYDMDGSSEFEFEFHRAESHCPNNGEYGNRKNSISGRIDLSQVYGSTLEQEMTLRDPTDTTKHKIGPDNTLQENEDGSFCCGDARCGEMPFLIAQHVLWLKHHNLLVDELIASGSTLQGDALYEEAKRLNIATYQRIVDKEFLPALVGPTPTAKNWRTGDWIAQTYDSTKINIGSLFLNQDEVGVSVEMCREMVLALDVCKKQFISHGSGGECICTTVEGGLTFLPATSEWKTYEINKEWISPTQGDMSISNLFANAAYRLHHLVNDEFEINGQMQSLKDGHFLSKTSYVDHGSIDAWFTRLLQQKSNKFGAHMATSLQHALFSGPGKTCNIDDSKQDCRDLAALNCLRGVDVGLPTYNEAREMFGLSQREDFDWSVNACNSQLGEVYEWDIDRVELFVGGSCEEPVPGAVLGETFLVIVKDQFLRLRDNDPNWIAYQSPGYSYKDVINRVTNVDSNLFHDYASFLHKDTPVGNAPTQKPTQEQFMLQIRGLQGDKEDVINKKVLDQDTLQINEVY